MVSELSGKTAIHGLTSIRQKSPIQDMRSGRHSSSVPPPRDNMDPKTPCIAEAARRLLRTEGCTLEVNPALTDSANELALHISDSLPSLIREPEIVTRPGLDRVLIRSGKSRLAQLAGAEPEMEFCWVPDTGEGLHKLWLRFVQDVSDLLAAGYPGCLGCGGPGAEGPWDELASRARTRA